MLISNSSPTPKFGLLSPKAVRDMDAVIHKNPVTPEFKNIKSDSWWANPEKATILANHVVVSKDNFEVRQIVLDTSFAKDLIPGQHLFIGPSDHEMELGNLAKGYRRYSMSDVKAQPDAKPLSGDSSESDTILGKHTVAFVYRRLKNGLVSEMLAHSKPLCKINVQGLDWNGFVLPPRQANMLSFSTGIANVGPMQFLLKTRLQQQDGELGITHLYSTC
jgi:hypothetical protein